jgi:hypothetical protein
MLRVVDDAARNVALVVLEDVQRNPLFGVNNCSLCEGKMAWEMALISRGVPYRLVRVNDWRSMVGLKKNASKDEARILAQKLFPKDAHYFQRIKDHDRAEAALMAECARLYVRGNNE